MSDLDPTHVEAVADLVGEWLFRMHGIQSSCDHHAEATELLTSTDPAVHEALLAALVRAGVLEEERWRVKCTCGKRLEGSPDEVEAWVREHDDSPLSKHIIVWNPPSPRPWKRRYVTRWEDVDA